MSTVPQIYLDHLAAVSAGGSTAIADVWESDGVLEFPYAASLGTALRLTGIDEIEAYFSGLDLFRDFVFGELHASRIENEDEFVIEFHGSATLRADGSPYEQDYIVRFGTAPSGRIAWMREFWDPTRARPRVDTQA